VHGVLVAERAERSVKIARQLSLHLSPHLNEDR
jgi:hypothetical protein